MVFKRMLLNVSLVALSMQHGLVVADAQVVALPTQQEPRTVTIQQPQEATIALHKDAIGNELYYNNLKKYGVKSVAILTTVFMMYKFLQSHGLVDRPVVVAGLVPALVPENLAARLAKLEEGTSQPFGSLRWFKHMGALFGEHLMIGVAAQAVAMKTQEYIEIQIFHPGSVVWFMLERTKFGPTLKEIEQYAIILDAPQAVSEESARMHRFFMVSACNNLVKDIESIIGFMQYRQTKLSETVALEAGTTTRYIFNLTGEFSTKMNDLLNNTTLDTKTLRSQVESCINNLKSEMHRVLVSFSRIELQQ